MLKIYNMLAILLKNTMKITAVRSTVVHGRSWERESDHDNEGRRIILDRDHAKDHGGDLQHDHGRAEGHDEEAGRVEEHHD